MNYTKQAIKFATDLVPLIKNGTKTRTYRVGDKYNFLQTGDTIMIENSKTHEQFGTVKIIEKSVTTFGELPLNRNGHEAYTTREQQRETFKKYYGREIPDDEKILVLGFQLQKQKTKLHKAGGILIKDRKILLERHGGKNVYIIPGGKLELGETAQQALIRELQEEFGIIVQERDLQEIGSFESPAVHSPDSIVQIDTFLVKKWSGEITLQGGIEDIAWVNSEDIKQLKGSTIAKEHIIPLLHKMSLID